MNLSQPSEFTSTQTPVSSTSHPKTNTTSSRAQTLTIWEKQHREITAHIAKASTTDDQDTITELQKMLNTCRKMWCRKMAEVEKEFLPRPIPGQVGTEAQILCRELFEELERKIGRIKWVLNLESDATGAGAGKSLLPPDPASKAENWTKSDSRYRTSKSRSQDEGRLGKEESFRIVEKGDDRHSHATRLKELLDSMEELKGEWEDVEEKILGWEDRLGKCGMTFVGILCPAVAAINIKDERRD